MKEKTPMQELRDKLVKTSNEPNMGPFSDEYHKGYSDALKNVATDIEAQMLEKEKQMVIDAVDYVVGQFQVYDNEGIGEHYYNEKYNVD